MVGKILMIVLAIVLALLLTALLIPVYVRITYESGVLCATMRYAKLTIPLYPGKQKNEEEDKAQPKAKPAPTDEQPKEKENVNWEQIRYSLDTLPAVLTKALKRTGRRIRIEPLKLHILVATGDPADTAVLYGKLEGVLAATLPTLHRLIRIREQDIRLFPDFCEDRMDVIADVGVRIRPLDLAGVAIFALGGMLKWFVGFRKRVTKIPKENTKHEDTTAEAGNAA